MIYRRVIENLSSHRVGGATSIGWGGSTPTGGILSTMFCIMDSPVRTKTLIFMNAMRRELETQPIQNGFDT